MPPNEFELITRYFKDLTQQSEGLTCGSGDDAAIISIPAGLELAVSTDTLVAGIHFPEHTHPFNIGYKALAVNLSDLAAIAALPRWALLSLTLPRYDHDWLSGFGRGLAELADRHKVGLIGGDMSRGPLSITIQIMGTVAAGGALLRSGARAGDGIYVSGTLGCAALALSVLQGKQAVADIDVANIDLGDIDDCLTRLRRPEPRLALGQSLADFASAAIDISDGLAGDLGHLLKASAVSAVVELERIPVCKKLSGINDTDAYWQLALAAGDDYELCFTVPPALEDRLEAELKNSHCAVTRIGEIVAGAGEVRWLSAGGEEHRLAATAYQHF